MFAPRINGLFGTDSQMLIHHRSPANRLTRKLSEIYALEERFMVCWRLTKRGSQRFNHQHPWVFSNELSHSPKGILPGTLIRLEDHQGHFLALGYGNPQSLIAFRTLTRQEQNNFEPAVFLKNKLLQAFNWRRQLGLTNQSFRWCFAEADSLPGLVIDYYLHSTSQTVVVQINSAGAENLFLPHLVTVVSEVISQLEKESGLPFGWPDTTLIQQRDSSFRKLEGLDQFPTEVAFGSVPADLQIIKVRSIHGHTHELHVNLLEGQKTGFFLDQAENVIRLLESLSKNKQKNLKVLDLCCYVGQWSSQIASLQKNMEASAEVTLVDVSSDALKIAQQNVSRWTGNVKAIEANVLRDTHRFAGQKYDVVIVDPPAFVKNKKDLPNGLRAYEQMNRRAGELVAENGFIISCSCSGLVSETDFSNVLAKSLPHITWFAHGGQASDHPILMQFPEGKYLKCWIGVSPDSILNRSE